MKRLLAIFAFFLLASPTMAQTLQAWFTADSITGLTNGQPVSAWSDISGNSHNATASGTAEPTYTTNVLNGLPGVSFNGSSNVMKTSPFALSQPMTAFVVGKMLTNAEANRYWIDDLTGNSLAMSSPSSTNFSVTGTTNHTIGQTVSDTADFAVMGGLWNGTSLSLSDYNGTLVTGDLGTGAASGLTLGDYGAGGPYYGYGYINEVFVYSGAPTTAQRQLLEGYLAWKWGLQANLPSGHPWQTCQPLTAPATPWTPASSGWSATACPASSVVRRVRSSGWTGW